LRARIAQGVRIGKKPWIDVNGASLDAIAAQVRKCPSGALSYELLKKKA
jgi:uncharacterized Fe-S cluster protein YjdI